MRSSIKFAMHNVKLGALTTGIVQSNFKGRIKRFVARDNAFSFMSSAKGTPAYWKQFLFDVLAMVKQLGIPTYFLTFLYADLRWEELPYIIKNLNNLGLSDEELKNLSCNLLNNNPVLVARHFQYKVEVFFKETISDAFLGEIKNYAICIEFQEWGSPHAHSFTWIFNAPNIENDAAYIEFIEKVINTQLPHHLSDPELYELVKTCQNHTPSRTCWKYSKNECCFYYGCYFIEKTIIAKPIDSKFCNEKKQEISTCRNTLLSQVKSYIDNNLYPAKVNVIGPTKDNFTQPLSVKEILDELEISKDDYHRAFSISKDDDLELHLKREPNSCFANNCFDVGLKPWQANMNIQPVL